MSERLSTSTDEDREKAVAAASLAIQRGDLVVLPTDTVYGIAADAFDADAVEALLDAKKRGRDMPPPVLVSSATTLDALAVRVPAYARALVEAFWPGPLTVICHQQASLQWDLGDTRGTVAMRMPDHPLTLEILERTGPLAVTSANLTGEPAATDADQAEEMLGEEVALIIDDGPSPGGEASTIIDATGSRPLVLRQGAISAARIDEVLATLGFSLAGDLEGGPVPAPAAADAPLDAETPFDTDPVVTPTARKTAEKSPAAKKAPAKKGGATKSGATRSTATRSTATKATATKATAKKATAKKATAKKTSTATTAAAEKAATQAAATTSPTPVPPEETPVEQAGLFEQTPPVDTSRTTEE